MAFRESFPYTDSADAAGLFARIDAIEGLRGWLAITVVICHLMSATNVATFYKFDRYTMMVGGGAVDVFILLSGFVIAGLILRRQESWPSYITQRAFRLFPAYWIALTLGGIAMFLQQDAFEFMTWRDSPLFQDNRKGHTANFEAVLSQPITQILVHVALLQSAVPPVLVPYAPQSILVPAWSLSLEWQFYLVAPLLVWVLRQRIWALALVACVLVSMKVFASAPLDEWVSWTSLPKYLPLFVIGILTRLALPHVRLISDHAWLVALVVLGFGLQLGVLPAIPVFLAFAALMTRHSDDQNKLRLLDKSFSLAFISKPAQWLGARSYSIYIIHYPILSIASWALLRFYPFTRLEALGVLALVVLPLTIIASDIIYRYVEIPGIALGKRLAAHWAKSDRRSISKNDGVLKAR